MKVFHEETTRTSKSSVAFCAPKSTNDLNKLSMKNNTFRKQVSLSRTAIFYFVIFVFLSIHFNDDYHHHISADFVDNFTPEPGLDYTTNDFDVERKCIYLSLSLYVYVFILLFFF